MAAYPNRARNESSAGRIQNWWRPENTHPIGNGVRPSPGLTRGLCGTHRLPGKNSAERRLLPQGWRVVATQLGVNSPNSTGNTIQTEDNPSNLKQRCLG